MPGLPIPVPLPARQCCLGLCAPLLTLVALGRVLSGTTTAGMFNDRAQGACVRPRFSQAPGEAACREESMFVLPGKAECRGEAPQSFQTGACVYEGRLYICASRWGLVRTKERFFIFVHSLGQSQVNATSNGHTHLTLLA